MPPRKNKGLTPSEERFIAEYLVDYNGTRAYHVAFPEAAYTTCRTNAPKLLAKAFIKQEVKARKDARRKRVGIRADNALREAGHIAFADPIYLYEDDGVTLRNIRKIPPETRRAIAGVKIKRGHTKRRPGSMTCPHCKGQVDCQEEERDDTIDIKLVPKQVGLDKVWGHLGLTKEIPALDALLAVLPADLAKMVREALAGKVPQ